MPTPAQEARDRAILAKYQEQSVADLLTKLGRVQDQETEEVVPYSPTRITRRMQVDAVRYMTQPPRNEEGRTMPYVGLKGRQSGLSLTIELAAYFATAQSPGLDMACMADTKDRAEYLHDRVQLNHRKIPEPLRVRTIAHNETGKSSFWHGGKMRTMSAGEANAGIGQSIGIFHGSEVGFWEDAVRVLGDLGPAFFNRREMRQLWDCTPVPASAPGFEAWRDMCLSAKTDPDTFYGFYPFWDSKLNVRPWKDDFVPDLEEIRLMEQYGPYGLTWENLAFRRFTLNKPGFKTQPELFLTYYPFDDVTCWQQSGKLVIGHDILDRRPHDLVAFDQKREPYKEFEPPKADTMYLLMIDGAGYGKDHSAFHVFEVWADDARQVATYAANTDPTEFNRLCLRTAERYNNAFVAIERNGVGLAVITHFEEKRYRRLVRWHDKNPGIPKNNEEEFLDTLAEMLIDVLTLRSKPLYDQILTYKNDRLIAPTARMLLVQSGGTRSKRRERHHWDSVSALMIGCMAIKVMPQRFKPRPKENVVVLDTRRTSDEKDALLARRRRDKEARRTNRRRVKRTRRRQK